MPTVISYDSPLLATALAANDSQAKGGQQSFEDSIQAEQANSQRASAAAQWQGMLNSNQNHQAALAQQAAMFNASRPQMVESPPVTTGGPLTGQPTVYNPAGAAGMIPAQQAAQMQMMQSTGGGTGGGGGGGQMASMAHLPRNAQMASQQLDTMHAQGSLTDGEYQRRKGILLAGGDPFSEPTEQEKQAELQNKAGIEGQRQQHLDQQKASDQQQKQRKDDLATERQALLDQIQVKKARLADPLLPATEKKMLHDDLDQIGRELRALPQKMQQQQSGAPDGSSPKNAKPLPKTLMQQFIRAAGYDPQKAKQLAAAKGFDPNQVVDDRPDGGIQITPNR